MNIFQFVFFSIIFKCLLVSFYSDQRFSSVVFSPKGAQVISIFFSSDDSFDDMTHQLTIWQFERWYIAYICIYIYILYVLLWRRQNPDLSDLAIEMLWCTACLKHCQAAMTIERLWKADVFQCNWRYERNGWYPNFQRLSYASWNLHPCWVQIISLSLTDS